MSAHIENKIYCPCGAVDPITSRRFNYSNCCEPLHGGRAARSPEALMRARFSAYAFKISDYLLQSWHPDFRPGHINLSDSIRWCQLHISHSHDDDKEGQVRFTAIYFANGQWFRLAECSQFVKQKQDWLYTEGSAQVQAFKPKRNEPCPCGSGLKAKRCC